MKRVLSFVCFLIYMVPLSAQNIFFEKSYGDVDQQIGNDILTLSTGNYLIVGEVDYSNSFSDIFLAHLNSVGDTTSTSSINLGNMDRPTKMIRTLSGNVVICGYSGSMPNFDFMMIESDTSGQIQWSSVIPDAGDDKFFDVIQTSDKGYAAAGFSNSGGSGNYDAVIVKFDSAGNTSWTKYYDDGGLEKGYSLKQTSDGGYILAAVSDSSGANGMDIWLLKTNSSGDTSWTQKYGGNFHDTPRRIRITKDGGYVVCGMTFSNGLANSTISLLKTNNNGVFQWIKNFGPSGYAEALDFEIMDDEGFAICGYTEISPGSPKYGYVIKTNSWGDSAWTKIIGGTFDDYFFGLTVDGNSIISTGTTSSFNGGSDKDLYVFGVDHMPVAPAEKSTPWVPLFSGTDQDIGKIKFFTQNNGIAIAKDKTFLKTKDGGNSWTKTFLPGYETDMHFLNSNLGYVVGDSGFIAKTIDGGINWTTQTAPNNFDLLKVMFATPSIGFAVGITGNLIRTVDGGGTWQAMTVPTTSTIYSLHVVDSANIWFATINGDISNSTDGGLTWSSLNHVADAVMDMKFTGNGKGYFIGVNISDYQVFKTVDNGVNWILTYSDTIPMYGLTVVDANECYVVSDAGTISYTLDGGSLWNIEMTNHGEALYNIEVFDSLTAFVGGAGGVLYKKAKDLLITTIDVTNTVDTMFFNTQGVKVKFDFFDTHPDSTCVVVAKFPDRPPHSATDDSIATVFSNNYWKLTSTIRNFIVDVCMIIDTSKYNTSYMDYLNVVSQENPSEPWSVTLRDTLRNGNEICFETTHFSNWAIATTKPDPRSLTDTVFMNSTGTMAKISKNDSAAGLDVSFLLQPGQSDSLKFAKYDINPGGTFPEGLSYITESFWEIGRTKIDTADLYFYPETVKGFAPQDTGRYRLFYRPDASTDWVLIPSSRVRKGMKEALYVRTDTVFNGHFIFAKVGDFQPVFSAFATATTACVGEAVQFAGFAIGGLEPFNFSWSGDDSLSGVGDSITHVFDAVGLYNYTLYAQDTSGAIAEFSGTVDVNCVLNVENISLASSLLIFPNPVENGVLHLQLSGYDSESIKMQIVDVYGRIILYKKLKMNSSNNLISIDLENISKGVYFINLTANQIQEKRMFILK